ERRLLNRLLWWRNQITQVFDISGPIGRDRLPLIPKFHAPCQPAFDRRLSRLSTHRPRRYFCQVAAQINETNKSGFFSQLVSPAVDSKCECGRRECCRT